MAWLAADASFDPDRLPAPVIGIAAQLGDHDSGLHRHRRGQLLFTQQGCSRITLDNQLCLLPPTRAAWIPCGVPHRAQMHNTVDYRSVYMSPALADQLPQHVRVIEVSALLRAVLEPMAMAPFDTDWQTGRYAHLLALCLDEIQTATEQPMLLPLPRDKRLAPLLPIWTACRQRCKTWKHNWAPAPRPSAASSGGKPAWGINNGANSGG